VALRFSYGTVDYRIAHPFGLVAAPGCIELSFEAPNIPRREWMCVECAFVRADCADSPLAALTQFEG
jgi:hypothetical protein